VIAAAYLHDTVEDTVVTHADLVDGFGARVAGLVAEVTDDKSLPKVERMRGTDAKLEATFDRVAAEADRHFARPASA
ncbi:HD domain-containing protein, partial [Prosthecomicrobium hirschii]|uniref:HD domain-containing protein n=1 Tax=Prosthecodimorpha hirschii TaxID=665126 RepID=UPI00128F4F33